MRFIIFIILTFFICYGKSDRFFECLNQCSEDLDKCFYGVCEFESLVRKKKTLGNSLNFNVYFFFIFRINLSGIAFKTIV